MIRRVISSIVALCLVAGAALGQSPFVGLVFPPKTVMGNPATQSDFGSAVPFSTFMAQAFTAFCSTANAVPVYSAATGWGCQVPLAVASGGTNCSAATGTCLDNITGFASTGMLGRTGAGQYAQRTVTGTANEITSTNGDGVAGNPTLSLPSALTFTGKTVTGGTYNSITANQPNIVGTTTNDNAAAGSVGEYVSSSIPIGSAVALTTGVNANITSIPLTAGDWDVWVNARYTGAAGTTVTYTTSSISTTSATLDTNPGKITNSFHNGQAPFGTVSLDTQVGPFRVSLSGNTTVFFVAQVGFAVSTCSGFGIIQARRRR